MQQAKVFLLVLLNHSFLQILDSMGLAVEWYLDDLVLRKYNTLLSGSYACIVTSSVFHGQKF
jgi:hypothetical protein